VVADEVPLGAQFRTDVAGLPVAVELGRAGLECLERVGEDGQILILDADQVTGTGSGALSLGHDQGHLVADKAHHIGVRVR
jgi:hypothetical protein